jgi:hypothetical protein
MVETKIITLLNEVTDLYSEKYMRWLHFKSTRIKGPKWKKGLYTYDVKMSIIVDYDKLHIYL